MEPRHKQNKDIAWCFPVECSMCEHRSSKAFLVVSGFRKGRKQQIMTSGVLDMNLERVPKLWEYVQWHHSIKTFID